MMKKLLILFLCILSLSLFTLFGSVFGLLAYKDSGYDWEWLTLPFVDSGVQITRTRDTHQLLLRKLYPMQSIEVSVYTTMDNKLVLQLTNFSSCRGDASGHLKINKSDSQTVTFSCDKQEQLRYSRILRHLSRAELEINGKTLVIDFSDWNIADLQKDQFKQLHPEYFKRLGENPEYQWARD